MERQRQVKNLLAIDDGELLMIMRKARFDQLDILKEFLTRSAKEITDETVISDINELIDGLNNHKKRLKQLKNVDDELSTNLVLSGTSEYDGPPLTEEELKQFKTNPFFETTSRSKF